jgi:predicted DNA-binding transcriptional regulator AlpA
MGQRKRPRHIYPPDYVSAETLAYRLDLAPTLIENYVRDGLLPRPELIGNLKRWDFAEVRAYIKARNGLSGNDQGEVEPNGRPRDLYLERLRRGSAA